MKDCEHCTPTDPKCTLQSLVSEMSARPIMDDLMLVKEANGSLRRLTESEEKSLGIGYIPAHEGPLEGTYPLYGAASHCQFRLVISRRN